MHAAVVDLSPFVVIANLRVELQNILIIDLLNVVPARFCLFYFPLLVNICSDSGRHLSRFFEIRHHQLDKYGSTLRYFVCTSQISQ